MKMATRSGRQVDFDDIYNCPIHIGDIVHGLSNLCRFAGQCSTFYSVAQHSVRVAMQLPVELQLAGLLHDATEAYLVDIPRPLKRHFPDYVVMENKLQARIYSEYGVEITTRGAELIREADDAVLCQEWKELMPTTIEIEVEPAYPVKPWTALDPTQAYDLFYMFYNRAINGGNP